MKNIIEKVKRHISSLIITQFLSKPDQKRFNYNYINAKQSFIENRNKFSFGAFLMPDWQAVANTIETHFLENFSVRFLRIPILKSTMFAHLPTKAKNIQKKLILDYFGKNKARQILKESLIGAPLLNDFEFRSSGNSIHHLYHLTKFTRETSVPVEDLDSILELGGGYGNMAKIVTRINPNCTYCIIDIPIFSYIQYVYLSTVLGDDKVVWFNQTKDVVPGKINLIPLDSELITQFASQKNHFDLFISTWALSESNEHTQKTVKNADYFGARYLLLAYQKANEAFQFAQQVTDLNDSYTTLYNEQTEYMDDNYYSFAKRK